MPIVVDWEALQTVMNNCAPPNASLTTSVESSRLCGLCSFTTDYKSAFWKTSPLRLWTRCHAGHSLWEGNHLFNATPDECVWEPLHCHCRVLSHYISYIIESVNSTASTALTEMLDNLVTNGFSEESGFTIKTVCTPLHTLPLSHTHSIPPDQRVL